MKKIPRVYLYLLVVVVAAIAVFFLEKPTEEKTGDILNKPLLQDFNPSDVAKVEVEHLLNGVQLKKENGEWVVASFKTKMKESLEAADKTPPSPENEKWFKADAGKIDLALDTLLDLNTTSIAGNNPEKHGTFEVNNAGMQLRLYDESWKKWVHLYIGKAGAGFLETHVRKEGENEVTLVNRYLRTSFPPDVDSWRDRKIWDIAVGNIDGIRMERGKNPFTLQKVETLWKLSFPKASETDTAKVGNLVQQLSKITAAGFEGELKGEMGLDKPSLKITLVTTIGPLVLKLGKERDKNSHQFYAQKEGDPQVYLVSESLKKFIPEDWKELVLGEK